MSIYLRGSTWWYSITMDGKTYRASCKTSNEKQAQELHDIKKAELWRQVKLGDKPKRTWLEARDRWLKDRSQRKSLRADKQSVEWWDGQFEQRGLKYLEEITPDVVAEIRDEEAGRKKQRGGGVMKPATVNRKITTLRSIINAACRKWLWLDRAPLFEKLEEHNERVRWLTVQEVDRLARALPEPYGQMVLFAVFTGLRRGNITGLRWDYVNLVTKTLTLPHQVMKNGAPLTLPLNKGAVEILRGQIGKHDEWVFPRWDGERVIDIPSGTWAAACKEAGIEDFRFHDTRHTWASLMRQNGVGLDRLQELGGWKDASMVRRYGHLSVSHLAADAAVMDGVFGQTAQILHIATVNGERPRDESNVRPAP